MRIHSRLGPGLKERHYQRALIEEVRKSGRTADEEYFVELWDGEVWLGRLYLDVLVDSVVDAEIKSHPLDAWQSKVSRFLWRPDHAGPVPEIVSPQTIRIVKPANPLVPDDWSPFSDPKSNQP